ncbi:MAG: hypothetical protein EA389_16885 [Ilumatobacter sp.]|nr:MAG: hypothetical protein EA389_16885 [Ilumatobacter sp.]
MAAAADRSPLDRLPDPFPEPPDHGVTGADHADLPVEQWVAEERAAQIRRSSIEAGRRKGGLAGAALAGSMLALRDIYEGPPKDQLPIEIEASGEPHDVDRDGISMTVDGVDVSSPPLPRLDPPD